MASTRSSFSPPQFILTPQQQNLLFAALTSNRPVNGAVQPNALSMSPSGLTESSVGAKPELVGAGQQEGSFLDYDYSFGPDSSFDFDFGNTSGTAVDDPSKMIEGGQDADKDDAGSSSAGEGDADSPDKRAHPDDDAEDGGGKRRESEEKVAKKPGRKPLTSEPSSVCDMPRQWSYADGRDRMGTD